MELKLREIFTDTGSNGLAETFREFLGYFVKQFFPLVKTQIEKLYFARFDYPLLVFPLLLLAITALWSFWHKPTRRRAILSGLTTGALFYSYFHYWVYLVVVIGLLFIYTIFTAYTDHASNKSRIKNFLLLLGTLLLAAAPYFINYLKFSQTESAHDYALRLGIAEGREPALAALGFDYLVYLGLALIAILAYGQRARLKAALIVSFMVAAPVVWNIQLVTGFVPAPNNWERTVSPFLFISVFIILYDLTTRLINTRPRAKKVVGAILFVLALAVIAKKVVNIQNIYQVPETRIINNYSFYGELTDSWLWINKNLPREPKILSNSFLTSLYLNSYTSSRPFLPLGNLTSQPTHKLEERFLEANKFLGTAPDGLIGQLANTLYLDCASKSCPPNTEENLRKNLWHLYWHYFRGGPVNSYLARPQKISGEYIDKLVARYAVLKIDPDKIPADYIYYGPWESQLSPEWRGHSGFKLIYQNPQVRIYSNSKKSIN